MLQDKPSCDRNLPWIITALKCIKSILQKGNSTSVTMNPLMVAIERMITSVLPDFRLDAALASIQDGGSHTVPPTQHESAASEVPGPNLTYPVLDSTCLYPSMPFGFDINGPLVAQSPVMGSLDDQVDITAADMGWNFDLGTMDMEAFLSIDANQQFNFST